MLPTWFAALLLRCSPLAAAAVALANKVCYHLLSPLPAVAVAAAAAVVFVGVANLARYNFLGLTFVLIHFGLFFLCACLATLFLSRRHLSLSLSAECGQRKGSDSHSGRGGSQLLLSCTKFVSFLLMRRSRC